MGGRSPPGYRFGGGGRPSQLRFSYLRQHFKRYFGPLMLRRWLQFTPAVVLVLAATTTGEDQGVLQDTSQGSIPNVLVKAARALAAIGQLKHPHLDENLYKITSAFHQAATRFRLPKKQTQKLLPSVVKIAKTILQRASKAGLSRERVKATVNSMTQVADAAIRKEARLSHAAKSPFRADESKIDRIREKVSHLHARVWCGLALPYLPWRGVWRGVAWPGLVAGDRLNGPVHRTHMAIHMSAHTRLYTFL